MKCDNKCKYYDEEDGCLYSYMGDGNPKHAPCSQNSTGEQTMDDLIRRKDAIDALHKKRIATMEKGQNVSLIWECLDAVAQVPSAKQSVKPEYQAADLKGQRIHYIKLNINFADSVSDGQKCFEIRKNDRGYKKGDLVVFKPVDDARNSVYHPIINKVYEITYVISGWGLKDGYCVFGIKKQPGRRGVML